ncbi:MAG: galactose mutarotase [Proteobacteria bacterium]|nr:galactose mutarotase [Pseudomonadota bacterium]
MKIEQSDFGKTGDGREVQVCQLTNNNGVSISVINFGATLISVKTPDKSGYVEEITIGPRNVADCENRGGFFGATVGRVANRIAAGKFSIDSQQFQLVKNEREVNHLHGGTKGISKVLWNMKTVESSAGATVICNYLSKDGEDGYPGNLDVTVGYTLTSDNELIIDYNATVDKTCPVNLTNHAYWNLSGEKKDNILGHELNLVCDSYLPVDENLIPTGEFKTVEGTPFDFRTTKPVGKDLEMAGGFDHCYVIRKERGECMKIAEVHDPVSGRLMSVSTTEPGVQFYSGNFLHRFEDFGFQKYDALCLEAQCFPDAVNQANFPSILLSPGEIYQQRTLHRFDIRD